jgi:hypothetical protein
VNYRIPISSHGCQDETDVPNGNNREGESDKPLLGSMLLAILLTLLAASLNAALKASQMICKDHPLRKCETWANSEFLIKYLAGHGINTGNPLTLATGTGMVRVGKIQPIPLPICTLTCNQHRLGNP